MSTHDEPGRKFPVANRVRQLRAREGRARLIGIAISVVVHAILVLAYAGIAGPPTVTVASRAGEGPPDLEGMELLNLAEEADEESEAEEELPVVEPPTEPEPSPSATPVPVAVSGDAADDDPSDAPEAAQGPPAPTGPSAAERLRVRTSDERLWAFSDEIFDPSMETRLNSDLAWRIDIWVDSMQAAMAREAAITDWTWTDAEGNRWGVSPGRLHLGSITLPLPFGFGDVPRMLEDQLDEDYIQSELARNALRGLIIETWQERNAAIRRRMDAEREERIENSGPRRAIPDTTRRGGG